MNSEFNGMVKASSHRLENAIAKFDAYKEAAITANNIARKRATEDKTIVKHWLFFNKEVSVWDSIEVEAWCGYKFLSEHYPEIITWEQESFLKWQEDDLDEIKALVSINNKEVYLSAEQALIVNKWCGHEEV